MRGRTPFKGAHHLGWDNQATYHTAASENEHCTVYLAPDVNNAHRARVTRRRDRSGFIDRARLDVRAGSGGSGAATFTRGPNSEVAPPDGGSGGHGGSVWLVADDSMPSLGGRSLRARAGNGASGSGSLRRGRSGEDCVLKVPPGTVARVLDEPALEGSVLCDLDKHGTRARIAKGGFGGRGNASYKSSTNRSPTNSQKGTPGDELLVELELKSIADVGLVGFPNAGKSTLLRAVSNARPRVASYPFTTLRPFIGVIEEDLNSCSGALKNVRDARRFTIADIPGLISGAHENRGLGHEFLRHVERTSMLVYVLDMSQGEKGGFEELNILQRELELYEPGLSKRPSCIAANKMDTGIEAVNTLRALVRELGDSLPVFPVSAIDHSGTEDLVANLFDMVRPLSSDDNVDVSTTVSHSAAMSL